LRDLKQPARNYIQISFEKTGGWMIVSFLSIFCILGLVLFPLEYIDGKIQGERENLRGYIKYSLMPTDKILPEEQFDFTYLQEKYKGISESVLLQQQEKQSWISFAYSLFFLICIEGLSFQVLVSYYFLFSSHKATKKKNIFSKWIK
jgi:hypothetical protein